MTILYKDPDDVTISLKSRTVSGEEVPAHDVASLPGTAETDISSSKGFLQTLAGMISAGRAAVDLAATPTANLASIASAMATLAGIVTSSRAAVNVDSTTTGKLDTLHTDLGTTLHTDLATTLAGYLSTLAGIVSAGRAAVDLAATPTANLATLAGAISSAKAQCDVITLPAPNSGGPYYTYVTNLNTVTQLSSQALKHGIWIRNLHATNNIGIGNDNSVTATNGYVLRPGEEKFIPCANRNQIYLCASASSTTYCTLAA